MTELAWGPQSQAVRPFLPIVFSSFYYKEETGKVLWFSFPLGANPAVWECKELLNSIGAKSHLAEDLVSTWQGHSKKSIRKNISIRQAFSWQHNLILRQSAVYAMPEQMTIYFIVPASLKYTSLLNPFPLLTSTAPYSNWLYPTI